MSNTAQSGIANKDQADYWSSSSGANWVSFQESLDALLQSVNDRLLERAAPKPAEKVLDIGCGTGATSLNIAAKVSPSGAVLGIDISRLPLDRANERRLHDNIEHLQFQLADAQTHAFKRQSFDLATSRFGVMFFADPIAAFTNLGGALRPGGRLSFVSWAAVEGNPWFETPRDAAIAQLGKPSTAVTRAPGPMAFADLDYVLDILQKAGFSNCSGKREQVNLFHPGGVEEAAKLASNIGPSARIVKEFNGGPADIAEIGKRVIDKFQRFRVAEGVSIPANLNFFQADFHGT